MKNSVPCTACHLVHKGFNHLYLWKNPEVNQMCAACHNNVWAAFQEPFTHELARGAICQYPARATLHPFLRL